MNSNLVYSPHDDHEEHQDKDDGMLMGLYDDNEVTETTDDPPSQSIEPNTKTDENFTDGLPLQINTGNDIDEKKENNVDTEEQETPTKLAMPPVTTAAIVPSNETTGTISQTSKPVSEEVDTRRVYPVHSKMEGDTSPIQRKTSHSTMGTYNLNNTLNGLTTPTSTMKQSSLPPSSSRASSKSNNDLEALNDEIATLLLTNKITLTTSSKLQSMLRENISLKEKITKLKALLSRSSKVSKETKVELEKSQREAAILKQRVESLANRPTHMDLLADFETNFDRALMSLHAGNGKEEEGEEGDGEGYSSYHQSGGEETRPPMSTPQNGGEQENVSALLLAELSQTKSRIEHLETLNAQLAKRSSQVTKENEQYFSQLERQNLKMSNFQLELRMAKMETENATREMKAKAASLAEMQMEIDLVTRSAMSANARVAEGMEVAKSIRSDQAQVEELKAKVAALQEWAVASAEAKEAILEENKLLEKRLHQLENSEDKNAVIKEDSSIGGDKTMTLRSDNVSPSSKGKVTERKLWTKSSSLVIGAGMVECRTIDLGENSVKNFETIVLRWKFDLTPNDVDIMFSILKGKYDKRDKNAMKSAHALIRERRVVGGGGGETEGAFVIQNACTLVFSNAHSWVRPRTVKYEVEAFAIA